MSRPVARSAFTLIEMLVVMAVCTVLLSLLIPAVQFARESARMADCRNRLRQIAIACHSFHSTHDSFPANGWGYAWVGEPERGVGKKQPGGWIYQIMPQVEQPNIWSIGTDAGPGHSASMKVLCETRIPLFRCPSRPGSEQPPPNRNWQYWNADRPDWVGRTDYAINEGDWISNTLSGPPSLLDGDHPDFTWKDVRLVTGISWLRDGARLNEISDGTTNTYLVGEKYVSKVGYDTAEDRGHDQSMFSGVDLDVNRWTISAPKRDDDSSAEREFGSAHAQSLNMALCDGSVKSVAYGIDVEIHRRFGNRADGQPTQ